MANSSPKATESRCHRRERNKCATSSVAGPSTAPYSLPDLIRPRFKSGPRSRITILELHEQPEGPEGLLAFPEIDPENLRNFIGNGDGSAAESLKTLQFLARYGIISNSLECPDCKKKMAFVKDRTADGYIWRCNQCRGDGAKKSARMTVRASSFFLHSRHSLETELLLIAHWASNSSDTPANIIKLYDVSPRTLADRHEQLQNLTAAWFARKTSEIPADEPNSLAEMFLNLYDSPQSGEHLTSHIFRRYHDNDKIFAHILEEIVEQYPVL